MEKYKKRKKHKREVPRSPLRKVVCGTMTVGLLLLVLYAMLFGYPNLQEIHIFNNPNVLYYSAVTYRAYIVISGFILLFAIGIDMVILYYSDVSPIHFIKRRMGKIQLPKYKQGNMPIVVIITLICVIFAIILSVLPLFFIKQHIEVTSSGVYHYNRKGQVTQQHLYTNLTERRVAVYEKHYGRYWHNKMYTVEYQLIFKDGYQQCVYLHLVNNDGLKDGINSMVEIDQITNGYTPKVIGDTLEMDKIKLNKEDKVLVHSLFHTSNITE